MAPKENQEDELFEELKNDLNVRLEKSFKASKGIIQAQRKTIQNLEVKLESTANNFHNFIQVGNFSKYGKSHTYSFITSFM